ncbi:MAG: PrgI family protein [Patescibacteria group bacterium]|nr:PrgI family protein [Patescibacteria group bacterium]
MQFQVPQFIETEDKIIGPLTLKQFFYLAAAGFLVFISFFVLQTWLWLIITTVLGGAALAMAFAQVNGRPMLIFVMNAFVYLWEPHSYSYTEEMEVAVAAPIPPAVPTAIVVPAIPAAPAKPVPAAIPAVPPTPVYAPAKAVAEVAGKAVSVGLKDLWNKLQTTKSAIPHREKPLAGELKGQEEIQEKYEIIRKITGESQIAKRVDYK